MSRAIFRTFVRSRFVIAYDAKNGPALAALLSLTIDSVSTFTETDVAIFVFLHLIFPIIEVKREWEDG